MFIIILIIMVGFGVVHSILAASRLKRAICQRIGERAYEGFYRIGYNFVAFTTLIPIMLLVVIHPGSIVWQVGGAGRAVLVTLQIIGIVGLSISLLQIDLWRFVGIKQLRVYVEHSTLPLDTETLQMGGLYGLVRHPLYFFSLLVLWPTSPMTEALLAFNIASTIYFMLGSVLEERKLNHLYGDVYRHYQQSVPWLIPLIRPRR